MRKYLLYITFFVFTVPLFAQSNYEMVVEKSNGAQTTFVINDINRVYFQNTENEITEKNNAPSYLNMPNERETESKGKFPFTRWEMDNNDINLQQFRTSLDDFIVIDETQYPDSFNSTFIPSGNGLDDLKISGSGQINAASLSDLKEILSSIHNGKIAIIDLRSETHGFFNGNSVSMNGNRGWGNIGKTTGEILSEERDSLLSHYNKQIVIAGEQIMVESMSTEENICDRMGFVYRRIPALDYTTFPSDAVLDDFISFVKGQSNNTWFHFHCAQGRGRTTLFMVLYDIMRNPDLTLDDIIYRQYLVGGAFLYDELKDYPKGWVNELAHERNLILLIFHQYVKQCQKDNFSLSWSEWKNMTYDFTQKPK